MINISPLAGKKPPTSLLVNIDALIDAYYSRKPDPASVAQRVAFGTSGHRGSSLEGSFNEDHILAIVQSISLYRKGKGIDGPLFLGIDTHALSEPARKSALEVLVANGVTVMLAENDEFTPTPVISHAICVYNRGRQNGYADGIVITPSHNPPAEGGIKYNPPHGGPAEPQITNWIQATANQFLESKLAGVARVSYEQVLNNPKVKRHDYVTAYVSDLKNCVDMNAIAASKIHIGVDPLGGAGVHYWKPIAEMYGLHLTLVNDTIDPQFAFMTVDWDGKIRMDPSSSYAMQGLLGLKERFDVAFACDTDHDRHGIVTKTHGLLPSNHYLSAAILYLFSHRTRWSLKAAVGKTLVSSQMIDRVASKLKRKLYEVPVGFKWFVEGLSNGSLAFGGEESAGATFNRFDGSVWTTDKDGMILSLLAAEITARLGKDPGTVYQELTAEFGDPAYDRIEAPATAEQKKILQNLTPKNIHTKRLAGEPILSTLVTAPGNQAPIGGLKVIAEHGWFAARPSGTEDIYKIYGESFLGKKHLEQILAEAQNIVNEALNNATVSQ